jgi:hypothetical protein
MQKILAQFLKRVRDIKGINEPISWDRFSGLHSSPLKKERSAVCGGRARRGLASAARQGSTMGTGFVSRLVAASGPTG